MEVRGAVGEGVLFVDAGRLLEIVPLGFFGGVEEREEVVRAIGEAERGGESMDPTALDESDFVWRFATRSSRGAPWLYELEVWRRGEEVGEGRGRLALGELFEVCRGFFAAEGAEVDREEEAVEEGAEGGAEEGVEAAV